MSALNIHRTDSPNGSVTLTVLVHGKPQFLIYVVPVVEEEGGGWIASNKVVPEEAEGKPLLGRWYRTREDALTIAYEILMEEPGVFRYAIYNNNKVTKYAFVKAPSKSAVEIYLTRQKLAESIQSIEFIRQQNRWEFEVDDNGEVVV